MVANFLKYFFALDQHSGANFKNLIFLLNFASNFLHFLFSAFLHKKLWKSIFWPVLVVCSTQTLVIIYNTYIFRTDVTVFLSTLSPSFDLCNWFVLFNSIWFRTIQFSIFLGRKKGRKREKKESLLWCDKSLWFTSSIYDSK